MNNVIEALRYMAEHGSGWCLVTFAGVWYLNPGNVRSISYDGYIGFTQDELRAFIEKYNQDQIELQNLRIEHEGPKNEN